MGSAVLAAVATAIDAIGPGLYGVACSGGADSMALADAAIRTAGAAHVVVLSIDHGLQPTSAAASEGVAAWARGLGAAGVVRRVEVERRASIEAAARDARYAALEALADELGLVAILVGHTARDQAETVLMRLLRGTGPAGLAAIASRRGRFVRPLLAIERAAIDAYVAERAVPTWADPMNDDPAITRVRVRHELLPLLRRENPQLDAALVRLATSASEWLDVIDAIASPLGRFPIDCSVLADHPPAIRKRAVVLALDQLGVDCEATHLEAIDRMVMAESHGEVAIDIREARVIRRYDQLECEPSAARTDSSAARTDSSDARIVASDARTGSSAARTLAAPPGPYVLRVWVPGDRMRPARLKGRSRKLSDLYVDQKLPRADRAIARVVVRTTDAVIVWAEHVGIAHGELDSVAPMPG